MIKKKQKIHKKKEKIRKNGPDVTVKKTPAQTKNKTYKRGRNRQQNPNSKREPHRSTTQISIKHSIFKQLKQ